MRTVIDLTTALWQAVKNSPLPSMINGSVYKNIRPANSQKEDIVVNSITLEGSESLIQRGVGNINIHLPNLPNGLTDDLKFQQLSEVAKPILESFNAQSYNFWLDASGLVRDTSDGTWYLNFRIRIKFHNTF